ncbi:hypothetical protein L2755_12125 [Shewanella abyssi]|uniref:hypothetical protein n=1 Tax=Shewanella abyssi TaxID=311789 RepID=UPI00201098B1|nr:hypothetical protein [Shewanella abyssi]MCL1050370.1 hypothetical protein [Shewanella abyssi]
MTDEFMLYEKMDMLNGLFATLHTEADKVVWHAMFGDVLVSYAVQYKDLTIEGSTPAAVAGVELVKAHEPALTQ